MTFTAGRIGLVAFAGAALVAIGTVGGCSGGPTSVGSGVSSHPSSNPTEVASVTAFDVKVTFYSQTLNGNTDIGMLETGSAFSKNLLVAPLLRQRLTTQEIYLALAPQGAIAPPALVAAQAAEAAAMNRSAEVRHVTVDSSQFVEKSLTSCENAILGTTPPDGSEYVWVLAYGYSFTDVCESFQYPNLGYPCSYTTDWIIAGGCNESSTVTIGVGAFEYYGSGTSCANSEGIGSYNMAPGYYAYWYWHNTGGAEYWAYASGSNCTTSQYDMLIGYESYQGR
jgi:hypothetical protein